MGPHQGQAGAVYLMGQMLGVQGGAGRCSLLGSLEMEKLGSVLIHPQS